MLADLDLDVFVWRSGLAGTEAVGDVPVRSVSEPATTGAAGVRRLDADLLACCWLNVVPCRALVAPPAAENDAASELSTASRPSMSN